MLYSGVASEKAVGVVCDFGIGCPEVDDVFEVYGRNPRKVFLQKEHLVTDVGGVDSPECAVETFHSQGEVDALGFGFAESAAGARRQ